MHCGEIERQVSAEGIELGGRVVRHPGGANLPGTAQPLESLGNLGRVREQIRPVNLPQVDPLHPEPPEGGVAGIEEIAGG